MEGPDCVSEEDCGGWNGQELWDSGGAAGRGAEGDIGAGEGNFAKSRRVGIDAGGDGAPDDTAAAGEGKAAAIGAAATDGFVWVKRSKGSSRWRANEEAANRSAKCRPDG